MYLKVSAKSVYLSYLNFPFPFSNRESIGKIQDIKKLLYIPCVTSAAMVRSQSAISLDLLGIWLQDRHNCNKNFIGFCYFYINIIPFSLHLHFSSKSITLTEGEDIISNDNDISETLNSYWYSWNVRYRRFHYIWLFLWTLTWFKNHPSVIKIKETVKIN